MGPRHGYRCRNACDPQAFSWDTWLDRGHSLAEMFPSFNNNSGADYNPEDPDYCSYYKATLGPDGKCTFDTSTILDCKGLFSYHITTKNPLK